MEHATVFQGKVAESKSATSECDMAEVNSKSKSKTVASLVIVAYPSCPVRQYSLVSSYPTYILPILHSTHSIDLDHTAPLHFRIRSHCLTVSLLNHPFPHSFQP